MKNLKIAGLLLGAGVLMGTAQAVKLGAPTAKGWPRLMNSPYIGHVTDSTALIWARTTDEVPVVVKYREKGTTDWKSSRPVKALKSKDFISVVSLTGLKANTEYEWDITVDGSGSAFTRSSLGPVFRTFPKPGQKGVFKIGMGSCSKVDSDRDQPIWNIVAQKSPNLFLWLGDNIYGDSLQGSVLRELYRKQRDVAQQLTVNLRVPQLATWDDHDFGINDYDARHPRKGEALDAFKAYWANPSYGTPKVPGVFFKTSMGDVDVFMLDGRYHRDPQASHNWPGKTLLGKRQLTWLKEELKKSKATFKLLGIGTPWNDLKGPTGDAWSGYSHERSELFEFIRKNNVGGVVLLSGDTHVAELNALPWSHKGGYDFYELVASPLGRDSSPGALFRMGGVKRMRPVFDKDRDFGLIEIDTTKSPATLSYMVYDTKGNPVWQMPFVVTSAELKNGVKSWDKKIGK